jgi:LmbE family N-acetylglucosaminyl deacetylase
MDSGYKTISVIEEYINNISPDIVFIPSQNDTHQDHRAVHLASLVATRNTPEVYIYQSPSTTKDFMPVAYFDITEFMDTKIKAVRIHTSQSDKIYMADRAIKGLAEYRAFDILKNDYFFEAFEVHKIIK